MRFTSDKRTLVVTIQDYRKGLLTIYRDTRTGNKVEASAVPHPRKDADGLWNESGAEAKARLRKLQLLDASGHPAFAGAGGDIAYVHESPDGRYLAVDERTGSPNVIGPDSYKTFLRIWDTISRRLIAVLDGERGTHTIVRFSGDGRTLLTKSHRPATIQLWESSTGREQLRLAGHKNGDVRMVFRSDGCVLVSGGDDTQVLLWDLTGRMPDGVWRQTRHAPEKMAELWRTMAGDDAARAYRAMWALEAAPEQTLALLRQHLSPMIAPDAKRLTRLLDDLDSDEFVKREKATNELERLGELAEVALRRVLKERPTLEKRRRCELLLEKLSVLSGERLRAVRAVEVLERLGTAEARALLEKLRKGVPDARLTEEARAALKRIQPEFQGRLWSRKENYRLRKTFHQCGARSVPFRVKRAETQGRHA